MADRETTPSGTEWGNRWLALGELDGDDWDAQDERLEAEWKAEYRRSFVAHALTRPGWDRENAEDWAGGVVDDAFAACRGEPVSPAEAAELDVIECEKEAADAC